MPSNILAGGSSRIPLQPVAVDMASEEPAEHSQLARLLTDLQSRGKSRVDPEMPLIRGLAGQDAARKVGGAGCIARQWQDSCIKARQ